MAIKTNGAEFKRFYSDPAYWPTDEGNTYHDDVLFTVDGAPLPESQSPDEVADDAVLTIEGGAVFGPQFKGREPSFETYFKRWRKEQSTVSFVVECDRALTEAVKTAIRTAGGKVA